MNRIELKTKIELFKRELKHLESIEIKCNTCEYGAHSGWCAKFQAVVPADVQAIGCDDWTHDGIPF